MKNLYTLSVKLIILMLIGCSTLEVAAQNGTYYDLTVNNKLWVGHDLIFNKNRSADSRGLVFLGTTQDRDWKWVNLSGELHLQTNAINNVFKIKLNGNVGIGVFDPSKKLDVGGDARISGTVTATSFIGDGSQLTGINVGIDGLDKHGTDDYLWSLNRNRSLGSSAIVLNSNDSYKDWLLLNSDGKLNLKLNNSTVSEFTIKNDGNVGIGTENPTEKLEVNGNAKVTDNLHVSGTVTATSFIGDGSQLTGITADHDGNFNSTVNIGNQISLKLTGDSFFKGDLRVQDESGIVRVKLESGGGPSNFYDGLQVKDSDSNVKVLLENDGTVTATSFIGDGSQLTGINGGGIDGLEGYGTTWDNWYVNWTRNTGISTLGLRSSIEADDWWLDNYHGRFQIRNFDSTPFTIKNDGNVGIGTDTPTEKLEVNGNTKVTGNLDVSGMITQNGQPIGGGIDGLDSLTGTKSPSWSISGDKDYGVSSLSFEGALGSQPWKFWRQGDLGFALITPEYQPAYVVLNNGNFGIGAGTPTEKLEVNGNTKVTGNLDVSGTITQNGQPIGGGIDGLEGYGTTWDNWYVNWTRNTGISTLGLRSSIEADDWWLDNYLGRFQIRNFDSTPFTIKNDGNVGIGTDTPTEKLEVNGNTKVSGDVTATSFIGDGSQLTGITADHDGIFDSNVDINGELNVDGPSFLRGNTFIDGDITISNQLKFNGGSPKIDLRGFGDVGISFKMPGFSTINSTQWDLGLQNTDFIIKNKYLDGAFTTRLIMTYNGDFLIPSMVDNNPSNFIISSLGNVGIGTDNPTEKLEVNGNTKVSGDVTATSFIGDGSQLTGIVTQNSNGRISVRNTQDVETISLNQDGTIQAIDINASTGNFVEAKFNLNYINENGLFFEDLTGLKDVVIHKYGDAEFKGTVTANQFVGDGSQLTNINHNGIFDNEVKVGNNIELYANGSSFFNGTLRIRDRSNNEKIYLGTDGFGGFRGGVRVEDNAGIQKITLNNNGNGSFDGTVTATSFIGDGSQLTGIDASQISNLGATGPDLIPDGKIVVQNGVDGGSSKGIYMWSANNSQWGIYTSQAGSNRSLNNQTATAGHNFSSHAIRFRVTDH